MKSDIAFVSHGKIAYLSPVDVLNTFTEETILKEDDPVRRNFYIKARSSALRAKEEAFTQGFLYGLMSLNLLWIIPFLVNYYKKQKNRSKLVRRPSTALG